MSEATAPSIASEEPLLVIRDLEAWYGESQILHKLSFSAVSGEVVTLLGRNGAGKSTTLKAIMGMVNRRGTISFRGRRIDTEVSRKIARCGIGYVPEDRGIFASLTVGENLVLPRKTGPGGMSREEVFGLFPNLRERLNSSGTKLSGGEQQMLSIGRILLTDARTLLLDEPTEGLAPVIVQQIGRTIEVLKERGYTIVLVEQNFRFASAIADRHVVVEQGRAILEIQRSDLKNNANRINRLLGL